MAPTYPNVVIHCVFSTKDRCDSIPGELLERPRLYCVGIGKNHDVPVLSARETANHVHPLMALPATIALAKAVQILKVNSSRRIATHGFNFAWQEGYGAFSLSASNLGAAKRYIEHQREHHAKHSFEDEFVSLLRESGVPYDPKFVLG